jgi:galactitol PTS system EIIA component
VSELQLFSVELCLPRLHAASAEDAIRKLAQLLASKGYVRASFEAAAVARERRSPTGLPFPDAPVALPHAEPEHVTRPAVVVATLAAPVTFREMGSPGVKHPIGIVVMPALSSKEQAAAGLTSLIELLQDGALRAALLAATNPDEIYAAIAMRAAPAAARTTS